MVAVSFRLAVWTLAGIACDGRNYGEVFFTNQHKGEEI
jgi:hypothetical protein